MELAQVLKWPLPYPEPRGTKAVTEGFNAKNQSLKAAASLLAELPDANPLRLRKAPFFPADQPRRLALWVCKTQSPG